MKKLLILLLYAAAAFADGANTFVFSLRPEFASGFTAIGVGASTEWGIVTPNNLYLTGELSGGWRYFGIEANIGRCLNRERELNVFGGAKLRHVLGGTAGYRNILHPVTFRDAHTGETLKVENGDNIGIAGGFWKITLGGRHNLDVTNKILFGYKKNPHDYDEDAVSHDKGFDVIYALGIGYTLKKVKN